MPKVTLQHLLTMSDQIVVDGYMVEGYGCKEIDEVTLLTGADDEFVFDINQIVEVNDGEGVIVTKDGYPMQAEFYEVLPLANEDLL